ncbi:hypothetical protein AB0F88_39965 [Streptosporangium sp. NPDC023963]|uniref:hypothetical protein n=1 Tax=Streptosporangium sp. NPDC023963 TaxID=3155608 RepID=UPI003439F1C3
MSRIVWTTTNYGTENGHVGSRSLFAIEDNSTSGKPSFRLHTDLPVSGVRSWRSTSSERLQAHAETVLADFVASLGAVFPTDTEEA